MIHASWNMSRGILERTENKIESVYIYVYIYCPLRSVWQSFCGLPRFEHIRSSQHFWLGNVVFPTTRRGLPGYPFLPGRLCQSLKHRRTHTFLKTHHPIVSTVLMYYLLMLMTYKNICTVVCAWILLSTVSWAEKISRSPKIHKIKRPKKTERRITLPIHGLGIAIATTIWCESGPGNTKGSTQQN